MIQSLVTTCSDTQKNKLTILDHNNDRALLKNLHNIAITLLQPSCSTGYITCGVLISNKISDISSDALFLSMMKLLTISKVSIEVRKNIIRGIRAPISEPALVFLGR